MEKQLRKEMLRLLVKRTGGGKIALDLAGRDCEPFQQSNTTPLLKHAAEQQVPQPVAFPNAASIGAEANRAAGDLPQIASLVRQLAHLP
jgi:hypothetical protein